MNTRPVSALILAAALSVAASVPMSAASKDAAVALPVQTVTVASNGNIKIERGMYRGDVSFAMKYKNREELSPNVWVYSGFHANSDAEIAQGCESVVITFANDKVVDLQLVNRPAATSIAANLRLGSSARNIASR
jgi:hypothetical protein